MYKKYRRGANYTDGLETAFLVTSVGLAATGFGLLSTIIAAPVAIGIGAGTVVCGLLGAIGKLAGRRLQAKARKHDLIRGLAESKLTADRISVALNDDKITEEEFRLILYEVDVQPDVERDPWAQEATWWLVKKQTISACERRSHDCSPHQVVERNPSWNQQ